jgi:membrane protein implicated in regulation of membrane protease activity
MKISETHDQVSNTGSTVLWMVCGGILAEIFLCLAAGGYKLYSGGLDQTWVKGEFLFLSFLLVSSPVGWICFAIGSIIALFISGKKKRLHNKEDAPA